MTTEREEERERREREIGVYMAAVKERRKRRRRRKTVPLYDSTTVFNHRFLYWSYTHRRSSAGYRGKKSLQQRSSPLLPRRGIQPRPPPQTHKTKPALRVVRGRDEQVSQKGALVVRQTVLEDGPAVLMRPPELRQRVLDGRPVKIAGRNEKGGMWCYESTENTPTYHCSRPFPPPTQRRTHRMGSGSLVRSPIKMSRSGIQSGIS